jgi:hypothetical protein
MRLNRLCQAILGLVFATAILASEPPANDCALVATEAYSVLNHTTWKRVVSIQFEITPPDGSEKFTGGHVMLVWQPWPGAKLHIYDQTGSVQIDTVSRKVGDVAAAIQRVMKPELKILSAYYWE